MAKTRRGLSSVARGVEERLKNALRFGSKRKEEVLEELHQEKGLSEEEIAKLDAELQGENIGQSPLSQPVPPTESTDKKTEDVGKSPLSQPVPLAETINSGKSMRELASNVYRLNKVEEMRTMFNLLISNYSKELAENPANADELREKLESKKTQLEEFDKEISIIKAEEIIEQVIESTNNLFDEVEKDFENLIENLDQNNYPNITNYINSIVSKLITGTTTPTGYTTSSVNANLDILNNNLELYKSLTGKEYTPQLSIKFFAEKYIKNIYGELESKIRQAQKELKNPDIQATKADSLKRMIVNLDNLITSLPILLEEPDKFAGLKETIDKALDKTFGERQPIEVPQPVEPAPAPEPPKSKGSTSLFLVMVEQKMKKIYAKVRELCLEFKAADSELKALTEDLDESIKNVTYIDEETKNKIVAEAEERYNQKIATEIGENVYIFITDYTFDYQSKQDKLNSCSFGTPEFDTAYQDLKKFIEEMKNAGVASNINVTFDESTQMLTIDFNSDVVKPFKNQIISNEIIEKINGQAKETQAQAKEAERIRFTEKVEKLFAEYLQLSEKELLTLEEDQRSRDIVVEVNDLINENSEYLNIIEKKQIVDEINDRDFGLLEQKYGKGFIEFAVNLLINWFDQIRNEKIEEVEFGTSEFDEKYERILKYVGQFEQHVSNHPAFQEYIKQISFDDENLTLRIDYKNENIPSYSKQIVSNELLNKIKEAKKQEKGSGSPVPPTPPVPPTSPASPVPPTPPIPPTTPSSSNQNDPDFISAKEDYISKINELNEIIAMINELNNRIESQGIFNFLDTNNAKNIIQLENEAKELDQRMMSLKIELSKDRFNIKKQFNIFVLNLPEVKNVQIADVEFSGNINEFISQRDEMIVEAENRILELAEDRKNNPQNVSAINEEINTLLQFIEAQNSIIGRRLVADCKTQDIDIVTTLKERRENKKEIRERLRQIKNEKVEPTKPQPTPEPAQTSNIFANKYRELLRNILNEELETQVIVTRICFNRRKPSDNLSLNCQNAIRQLDNNPYYVSVDKEAIKNEEYVNMNYLYQNIIEKEQIVVLDNMYSDLYRIFDSIEQEDVVNPDFESDLKAKLDSLTSKYPTIDNLKVEVDLSRNECLLSYKTLSYNFKTNTYEAEEKNQKNTRIISEKLFVEYQKAASQQPEHQDKQPEPDKSEVKINTRQLTFNPKMKKQVADKASDLIMEGDSVTISLIKNGIKIKYSRELREKLSKLNAKISLVNKGNYRSRTSRVIDSDTQEQVISFKDEREVRPGDYKIEVRIPSSNKSETVFEYDLADADEELRTRSR